MASRWQGCQNMLEADHAKAPLRHEAFALGFEGEVKEQSQHPVYNLTGAYSTCTVSYWNPIAFCRNDADALATTVQAAWRERAAIAGQLAQMPPRQLKDILTDGVLKAIAADMEPVIRQLASQPQIAAQWATAPHLALLPVASRRCLCTALLTSLDSVQSGAVRTVQNRQMLPDWVSGALVSYELNRTVT